MRRTGSGARNLGSITDRMRQTAPSFFSPSQRVEDLSIHPISLALFSLSLSSTVTNSHIDHFAFMEPAAILGYKARAFFRTQYFLWNLWFPLEAHLPGSAQALA